MKAFELTSGAASLLTEQKTDHIMVRDGFQKVGYVLQKPGGDYCISAQSAVRWLDAKDYWRLMHEQNDSLFSAPAEQSAPPVPRMGGITSDCRTDGRCQYAIDHGAEGLGACPVSKCCMPQSASTEPGQAEKLLKIIGYAYQIAGAHDAPDRILDVLADPEAATDEQVEAMLPYVPATTGTSDERDAARYRFLAGGFIGYDFFWGGRPDADDEEGKGKRVIVFELSGSFLVGRDFAAAIDEQIAALSKEKGQ